MRKSCFVQLLLIALLVVALAMTVRRYLFPTLEGSDAKGTSAQEQSKETESEDAPSLSLRRFMSTASDKPDAGATQLPSPRPATMGLEGLALKLSAPLMIEVPQITGLAADETSFYVSSYDAEKDAGLVLQISRDSHTISQVRAVSDGPLNRLTALHAGAPYLWAVVARADVGGPSVLLGLDRQSLGVKKRIEVGVALRAVVEGRDGRIYGLGQESDRFYVWSADGEVLGQVAISAGATYTDMDLVRGSLVCAGHDAQGGVLDVLDPESLTLLVRHRCYARIDSGEWVTDGGFAVEDGVFYFLPGQGKFPMLLSYELEGTTLDEYVPRLPMN